jgi:hypothetical protein
MNYTHTPRITAFNNDVSTATVTQFSIKKKKSIHARKSKTKKAVVSSAGAQHTKSLT